MRLIFSLIVFVPVLLFMSCAQEISSGIDSGHQEENEENIGIWGGVEAKKNQYKFMVELLNSDSSHWCGGALIAPYWVVTAAHCVDADPESFKFVYIGGVQAGGKDAEKIAVEKVIIHASYDRKNLDNDIALIKLKTKVTKYEPIALNKSAINYNLSPTATLIGWGNYSYNPQISPKLKVINLKLVSQDKCLNNEVYKSNFWAISETAICTAVTKTQTPCGGDSGGPLFIKTKNVFTLIGITSGGTGCRKDLELSPYEYFTDIAEKYNWIQSRIKVK